MPSMGSPIRRKLNGARNALARTDISYALAYPALNALQHGSIVRIPTFGLPCPTTILTGGLLLLASPRLRILAIVPMIWSAIGGSAAFLLGVSADYALPATGVALAVFELQRPRHRTQSETG